MCVKVGFLDGSKYLVYLFRQIKKSLLLILEQSPSEFDKPLK